MAPQTHLVVMYRIYVLLFYISSSAVSITLSMPPGISYCLLVVKNSCSKDVFDDLAKWK